MNHLRKKKKTYFESTKRTNKMVSDILPSVLKSLPKTFQNPLKGLKKEWDLVVGSTIASMTSVVELNEKKNIVISVKNSTLLHLLVTQEKDVITRKIRNKYPQLIFNQLVFKLS